MFQKSFEIADSSKLINEVTVGQKDDDDEKRDLTDGRERSMIQKLFPNNFEHLETRERASEDCYEKKDSCDPDLVPVIPAVLQMRGFRCRSWIDAHSNLLKLTINKIILPR